MGDSYYPPKDVPVVTAPERPRWIPPIRCGSCFTPIRAKVGNREVYPCGSCGGRLCEYCCNSETEKQRTGVTR